MAEAKKKKTKGKATSSKLYVTYEVLQNGAPLLDGVRPVRRGGTLKLTVRPNDPMGLPYYPLPNNELEFLRFDKGQPVLLAAHKWEGFCTSKGELVNVARSDKGRREITMHKGDYASITYEDLRILVKIGPKAKAAAGGKPERGYGRGFIHHFLPTIEEKRTTLVAALVAAIIFGGFVVGLEKRPVTRPEKVSDIAELYLLPFIAPAHLKNAPEALQGSLDRKHLVRSVINYYEATTAVLMGWEDDTGSYVLPTTDAMYRKVFETVDSQKAEKLRLQKEIDRLQDMKSEASIAAIPAVIGETVEGSMLRIIDKTGIMHEAFAANLDAKLAIVGEFPKDPEYSFEEYRNPSASRNDAKLEYLSKIRVFGQGTDEEIMYRQAEGLAAAASKQMARRPHGTSELVTPLAAPPVGIPAGARFASFAYDVDFMVADEKIAKITASEYGSEPRAARPAIAAAEPLTGEIERNLIETFISQHKFQLQLCYELALKRNELASGTMEWRWRIDSRGTISDIALVSSTLRDNRMTQCIRDKISQWRFPRPRRGAVEVSYPFEFAPSRG